MTNDKPRVSICLPVYNGQKYLEATLDSILAQTYGDFELIISDNASNDRTQDICLEYAKKDQRIKYSRVEKNLGAAPNHNRAFRLANGEYFKWAGYDDKISPNFLSMCVNVLDNKPDVVLCMPTTGLIDEHGQYLGEYVYKADASSQNSHQRFVNFLINNESGNYVYGLMRTKDVAQTALQGSFPSSDLVFLAELTLYGKFYVLPEPLFLRRLHPEQSTKGSMSVERRRVDWFDTSLRGKIALPKWQYLFGYLRAVRNAPMNLYQRIYCYTYVFRWALMLPHFRALGKDVLLAVQKVLVNLLLSMKNERPDPEE